MMIRIVIARKVPIDIANLLVLDAPRESSVPTFPSQSRCCVQCHDIGSAFSVVKYMSGAVSRNGLCTQSQSKEEYRTINSTEGCGIQSWVRGVVAAHVDKGPAAQSLLHDSLRVQGDPKPGHGRMLGCSIAVDFLMMRNRRGHDVERR
jgi:hypothetical protein